MHHKNIYRELVLGAGVAGLMMAGAALTPAMALERSGINLGGTSFFDGFGSTAPGCTYIQYMGHSQFDQFNGPDGKKLPAPVGNADLGVTYFIPQLACNSSLKLFGGTIGWNTVVPIAGHNSDFFSTNGSGFGDVTTGPTIQFAPVMAGGRPVFSHGFEFDIIAPTGKFDESRNINPGNDYWSINPFWKATWLPAPQWELSWRVNYLHNFDHKVNGSKLLTGDGVWVNFTASRELFKNFYFGLNGYWLKQLSEDKVNGVKTANSQQESLYIGPGFHYTIDPKNIVNFNVYLPVVDDNALSGGYNVNLQYIHPLN